MMDDESRGTIVAMRCLADPIRSIPGTAGCIASLVEPVLPQMATMGQGRGLAA